MHFTPRLGGNEQHASSLVRAWLWPVWSQRWISAASSGTGWPCTDKFEVKAEPIFAGGGAQRELGFGDVDLLESFLKT